MYLDGLEANENQTHLTDVSQSSPKILNQEVTSDPETELKKARLFLSLLPGHYHQLTHFSVTGISDSIVRKWVFIDPPLSTFLFSHVRNSPEVSLCQGFRNKCREHLCRLCQQTFYKEPDFVGHTVSVITTQRCCCVNIRICLMLLNMHGRVPIKQRLTNIGGGPGVTPGLELSNG